MSGFPNPCNSPLVLTAMSLSYWSSIAEVFVPRSVTALSKRKRGKANGQGKTVEQVSLLHQKMDHGQPFEILEARKLGGARIIVLLWKFPSQLVKLCNFGQHWRDERVQLISLPKLRVEWASLNSNCVGHVKHHWITIWSWHVFDSFLSHKISKDPQIPVREWLQDTQ